MFLARHAIECPSFARFLIIMLTTPGNTSPVQQGFLQLDMVATNIEISRKPENLQTLFLFVVLKIPVKPADCYKKKTKILEQ